MWKFLGESLNDIIPACSFLPFYKQYFMRKKYSTFENLVVYIMRNFERRVKIKKDEKLDNYHFSDNILTERNKILGKKLDFQKDLCDENVARLFLDFMFGSVESTYTTLCWLVLLMKTNSAHEIRLRQEVINNVGKRQPTLKDQVNCNFVMAFISETMRFRSIAPLSGTRKCMEDFKDGEFQINLLILNSLK